MFNFDLVSLYKIEKDITINKSLALRYLGYKRNSNATQDVLKTIDEEVDEISKIVNVKIVYLLSRVRENKNNTIKTDHFEINSKGLSNHIKNSKYLLTLAATIGFDVDRCISNKMVVSPSKSVVLDAIGSVCIEQVCDLFSSDVEDEFSKQNLKTTSRFSPGYGDLDIEYQKVILQVLDARRKIGLSLTDGDMLVPSKSVTAFIGIGSFDMKESNKCSRCMSNCEFRDENN